jgi:hypothetical protein
LPTGKWLAFHAPDFIHSFNDTPRPFGMNRNESEAGRQEVPSLRLSLTSAQARLIGEP